MSAARGSPETPETGAVAGGGPAPDAAPYETHLAVAVLCSELAHELAPTLAFLRDLVRSKLLAAMDHSIAEEEVARLEAIVRSLRRTKRSEEPTATLDLAELASGAVRRARAEGQTGAVALEIPRGLRIVANARGLELLLVSLLRNGMRAARRAPVVVRARRQREAEGSWCLEVEDDGEGLPGDLGERLFLPLATLGASGRGAGIPTVLRIARNHGWEVAYSRREGLTLFTVHFNPVDTSNPSQP